MRIRSRFLLIGAVWLGVAGSILAQASPLTPEQTAELFYRAWLNYDRASMLRLKREWGPADGGPRYIDLDRIADPIAWHLKQALTDPPPGTTPEQLRLFAKFMVVSSKRVRCGATAGRVGSQLPNGIYRARVELTCTVPDARSALHRLKASTNADELGTREHLPSSAVLKELIEVVATAPTTRHVSTKMVLNADPDKRVWRVGPTELGIERVNADLMEQIVKAGILQ